MPLLAMRSISAMARLTASCDMAWSACCWPMRSAASFHALGQLAGIALLGGGGGILQIALQLRIVAGLIRGVLQTLAKLLFIGGGHALGLVREILRGFVEALLCGLLLGARIGISRRLLHAGIF